MSRENSRPEISRDNTLEEDYDEEDDSDQLMPDLLRHGSRPAAMASRAPGPSEDTTFWAPGEDEAEALYEVDGRMPEKKQQRPPAKRKDEDLSSGIEAALAKLREKG